MKTLKKMVVGALAVGMVASLTACGSGSKGESANSGSNSSKSSTAIKDTNGDGKIKIGASYNSLMNDVFTVTQSLMQTWAKTPLEDDDPQVDLTIVVADGDTNKQISDVNDLINKGCDVIAIDPVDSTAVEPAIKACKDRKVPVITFNRPLSKSIKVKPDNEIDIAAYQQGYDTASTTFKKMKDDGISKINVVLCNGETRDDNSVRRAEGVKKAAEENNANIIAELPCDWDPTKVTELLPATLKGNKDINCVYVATDGMLSGVKSSLEDINKWAPYGKDNHMYIACCDLFEEGYNYVKQGYVDSDSLMDVYAMVKAVYQNAFALKNGEKVEELTEIKGATYTKDNIDKPEMNTKEVLWWKWKK